MNIREILRRVITPPATIPAPEPAGSSGGTDAQELCPSGGYLREDEEHVARLMVGRQQADPAVFTDAFGMKVDPSYCSWVKAGEVETKSPFPSSYLCDGIEFAALSLALLKYSAGQPNFTAVELGAGWGPWITMAALCAKRLGFEKISLVAFEADPHRYETLRRHLALNGITEDQYHLSLLCAAAWWRTETLYWPRGVEYDAGRMAVSGERPTHDYRGIESTFDQVPGLSISEALNDYPHIDFLHIDVQGSEWELIKNSVEFLSSRVRTMFIGTHSRKIEGDLIELLRNSGWVLLRERPCAFYSMAPSPTLTGQTFRDGGQVWGNLRSTTQNQIAATAHRPESELPVSRAREPDRVSEDGDAAKIEDSAALAVCRAVKALHAGVVTPNYERLLCQCYHRFLYNVPTAVILDVGAHSGFHLDYFARLATEGRVIAFEPLPSFAEDLVNHFRDKPNVSIRNMALGDTVGRASFCRIPDAPQMSGLRKRLSDNPAETTAELIEVQVETLDRQCADLDRVTYIKIDVEGGEIDCLRGGRQTIARHRPFISVEYGSPTYLPYGDSKMTLFVLATEMGYAISDLFGNVISTSAEWSFICDAAYWDYMLVPQERLADWKTFFSDLRRN